MKAHLARLAAAFAATLIPGFASADLKLQFLSTQILACANTDASGGWVLSQKLPVGGGQPTSGYSWSVTSGTTLPAGLSLDNLTGVIHISSLGAQLPAAGGPYPISITVTDQIQTANSKPGTYSLQVLFGNKDANPPIPCGQPVNDFFISGGPIPLEAQPNVPYGVALPVTGPLRNGEGYVGKPNFTWSLVLGSSLPLGMTLDQARGVVRGTPQQSDAGKQFEFWVSVRENNSNRVAVTAIPFVLTVCGSQDMPCFTLPGPKATPRDSNGDGMSDITHRRSTGNLAMWLMNGAQISQVAALGTVATTWEIVGQRDFDGDGKSDMLWRNSNGEVVIWLMDGTQIKQSAALGNIGSAWTVAGTGDFDGDGNGDILWRDTSGNTAVWLMNGVTVAAVGSLGAVPTSWTVARTADFNGDRIADILWRHTGGDNVMWLMNGLQVSSSASVGNVPASWSVVGAGDFNGDGIADILWRSTSGSMAVWLMDGATILQVQSLGTVPPPWSVAATGDFNGDGDSDILWRDSNGNVAMWLMNGAQISAVTSVANVSTDWTIQSINSD